MKCKVMQIQPYIFKDKNQNIEQIKDIFQKELAADIDMVCLPEMFSTPYDTSVFPKYAESDRGETWQICSALAREYGIYLSAGSIPEIDENGRIYNTAYVFDRQGNQIAKHRKVHLFDVDIKGGQYFKESDTLSAGEEVTVFDTEFGKMGICICFDIRFPELFHQMVEQGAKVILIPASFNMTTGPVHWELLYRARAVDYQCYIFGTSGARDCKFSYISWGHSIAVSPWGDVMHQLEYSEGVQITEIDLDYVEQIRQQLPVLK